MATKKKDTTLIAVAKRLRLYPGDTAIQIQIVDNGRTHRMFNVWRRSVRGMIFYENDRFGGTFKNITEAKQFALKKYKEGKR